MRARERNEIAKKLEDVKDYFIKLLPSELQYQFSKEAYIAGGSIHCLYKGKEVSDFDFFIESEELKDKLVNYFNSLSNLKVKFKGGVSMKLGTYSGRKLVITENAISIGKFQIVLRDIGTPEEVVSKFDFKHNMFYAKDNKLVGLVDESVLDLEELRFNDERARDIVSTIVRVSKFQKKGWYISPNEMGKMLLKLSEVGFTEEEIDMLNGRLDINSFGSGH